MKSNGEQIVSSIPPPSTAEQAPAARASLRQLLLYFARLGAITGAAFVLGRRALVDLPTASIAGVTLVVLLIGKKVPEPALILIAGVVGLWLHRSAH